MLFLPEFCLLNIFFLQRHVTKQHFTVRENSVPQQLNNCSSYSRRVSTTPSTLAAVIVF